MKARSEEPTRENSSNMNGFGKTKIGSTLDALKAAVQGEVSASAKYKQYSEAAKQAGFDRVGALFAAASDAEKVHIRLEHNLVKEEEPDWALPEPDAAPTLPVDLSLIDAANGEIYETSDMYPAFLDKAHEEGREDAVKVFTKAKLAESVHAERYLAAYNNLDAADDDAFWVCPGCGYIEKGEFAPEKCPICGCPASSFKRY